MKYLLPIRNKYRHCHRQNYTQITVIMNHQTVKVIERLSTTWKIHEAKNALDCLLKWCKWKRRRKREAKQNCADKYWKKFFFLFFFLLILFSMRIEKSRRCDIAGNNVNCVETFIINSSTQHKSVNKYFDGLAKRFVDAKYKISDRTRSGSTLTLSIYFYIDLNWQIYF